MSEFNCGNCRRRIDTYDSEDQIFLTSALCGADDSRELEVQWDDYCSKHLHVNLYDKEMHAKHTRANNTLLGY